MKRFRAAYGRLLEWVVIVLMVVLAVEVTLGVVFRFAGRSLIWYDEVASVLLAWVTFYGSALASVRRSHIGCPELVERMPWPARRAVSIAAQILVIAFFALLGGVGVWIAPILATDTLVSLPISIPGRSGDSIGLPASGTGPGSSHRPTSSLEIFWRESRRAITSWPT